MAVEKFLEIALWVIFAVLAAAAVGFIVKKLVS